MGQKHLFEPVDVVARERGNWHDVGKPDVPVIALDERQQGLLGDEVDLVQREDPRRIDLPNHVHHEAIATAARLAGVDDRQHDIDFAQRLQRGVHHAHVQTMQRPMHAGRIDEDDLSLGVIAHAGDAIARGLRLVGDDGELSGRPADSGASTCPRSGGRRARRIRSSLCRLPGHSRLRLQAANADARDASSLGFEHLDR